MTESQIERRFDRWVREQGALCFKFTSPSHRGVPDRLVIYGGRCAFLEFKAPGLKPTKLQRYEIERLLNAGVWAGCVTSFEGAQEVVRAELFLTTS